MTPAGVDGPRVEAVPGKWRAAAAYALLTLVLMYPLSLHPATLLPDDGPDTHLGIWMLGWDVHALTHDPLGIFDANTFYPHRRTLAYQDNYIGSAILIAPIVWLTGNPVVAVNAVPLLACVLCGLGAYILARRLGFGGGAAFLCGLVFAFCPARFFRLTQLGLAPVQWIPFTLASLHAYLDGGRRRDLYLACAFFTMQTLTSGHGAMFLVVAIVVVVGYRLLMGEPIRLARRFRDVGLVGAFLLLVAAATYVPYRLNQIELGLRRDLASWDTAPESFLASPTPLHAGLLSLAGWSSVNERASGFLFPGYIPIVLAMVAIVGVLAAALARWRRPTWDFVRPRDAWADPRARLFAAAAAAWLVLIGARAAIPAGDGLAGEYYRNTEWSGPAAVTVDRTPSADAMAAAWNGAPPATFSARWNGYLAVGADGLYRFATTSDDASRLFVDGKLVVDNSGVHAAETRSGRVQLTAGTHRVAIEYVQFGGAAALTWLWARDGAPLRPVPAWRLSRHRVTVPLALAARVVDWLQWIAFALAILIAAWALRQRVARAWAAWGERAAALRRNPVPLYLALALLCVGLSLGPPYSLWPYVYSWPGFSFIRVSRRFMVLGALAIAVLAGAGFDRLTRRLTPSRRRAACLATGALLVAEFIAIPIESDPFQLKTPAADQWLARQSKPFVVAEVPVAPSERYQTTYMLHSMAHWQKTVAGYGGIRPALSELLNAQLRTFPDETSVHHLARLGVTYVVVHQNLYQPGEWPEVDARLRRFEGSFLTLRYADAESRVYALSAPARVLSGSPFPSPPSLPTARPD